MSTSLSEFGDRTLGPSRAARERRGSRVCTTSARARSAWDAKRLKRFDRRSQVRRQDRLVGWNDEFKEKSCWMIMDLHNTVVLLSHLYHKVLKMRLFENIKVRTKHRQLHKVKKNSWEAKRIGRLKNCDLKKLQCNHQKKKMTVKVVTYFSLFEDDTSLLSYWPSGNLDNIGGKLRLNLLVDRFTR